MSGAIERIDPPGLAAESGRPQALVAAGRRWVFFNGQVGRDRDLRLAGPDLASQAHQCFINLKKGLEAVGATGRDVACLRLYVVDGDKRRFEIALAAGRKVFGDHWIAAPTLLMGVPCLARPQFHVALEAFAVLD